MFSPEELERLNLHSQRDASLQARLESFNKLISLFDLSQRHISFLEKVQAPLKYLHRENRVLSELVHDSERLGNARFAASVPGMLKDYLDKPYVRRTGIRLAVVGVGLYVFSRLRK